MQHTGAKLFSGSDPLCWSERRARGRDAVHQGSRRSGYATSCCRGSRCKSWRLVTRSKTDSAHRPLAVRMIASSPATAYIEELLNRDEPFPFGEATRHEMIMAGIKAGIFPLLSGWQLGNKGRDEHGRDVFFMHRYLAADDPETEVQRMVEEEMKKPRLLLIAETRENITKRMKAKAVAGPSFTQPSAPSLLDA